MILKRIIELLSEQFGLDEEEITEDTTLEEEFGIDEMGEEDIASIHNVGDLVEYIAKQGK